MVLWLKSARYLVAIIKEKRFIYSQKTFGVATLENHENRKRLAQQISP